MDATGRRRPNGCMSMSDNRFATRVPAEADAASSGKRLDDLAGQLSKAPASTTSPRRDLEHLVSMLAKRNIATDDRLANALEGLARWSDQLETDTAKASAPAVPAATRPAEPAQSAASASTSSAAPARQPVASLRAALAQIASRQKDLDDASGPARRPEGPAPAIEPAIVADLRREIDQLNRAIVDLPTRSDVDGLLKEIGELAVRTGDQRPGRLDPETLQAIELMVLEVERLRSDAVSPQTVERFETELAALADRLDSAPPAGAGAIDALAERIEDVRTELAQFPRVAAVEGLASDIQELVARLDDQQRDAERRAADARQAEADMRAEFSRAAPVVDMSDVHRKLDDLAERFEHKAQAPELAGLPGKLDVLDGKFDALAAANLSRQADVERVAEVVRVGLASAAEPDQGVAEIGRKIEALSLELLTRPNPADAVGALAAKVDGIDGRVLKVIRAELAKAAEPDQAVAEIGRKIEKLREELVSRPDPDAAFDALAATMGRIDQRLADGQPGADALVRIEDAVRDIAEHLVTTSSTAASASSGVLDGVETRISRLVDSLERTDGRIDDLNAGFAALAARIEQSCAGLGAEAGRAAAAAVRESFVEQDSAAALTSGAMAEALSEVRAVSSRNDRRTAETLDAVRTTLERLVSRMETFSSAGVQAPLVERLSADDRPMTAPAPAIDATDAARAAHRRALEEGADDDVEPVRRGPRALKPETDVAFDFPLEPGIEPRPQPFVDPEAAQQSTAALIAQARRANVHPAVSVEPASATVSTEPRAGAFMSTLKARRRPLLLALAAALIVLGVVKFASGLSERAVEMSPEQPAQSEPPAAPSVTPEAASPTLQAPAPEAPAPAPEATAPAAPAPEAPAPEAPAPEAPARAAPPPADEAPAAANPPPAVSPPPAPKPGAMLTPPRAPAADITDFAFAQTLAEPAQKFTAPTGSEDFVTGSVSRSPDALPDSIGGSMLRIRAVQGDPSAQLEIADRLATGHGVAPDLAAAVRWLEKAAAQGLAPAQHRLGSMYEKGRGVARDIGTARRWYEQAAASGNVRAMHNLGVIHAEGGLGKPDFNAAIVWFRMAAERGLVDSQYNLAVLEARGLGGKRDLADAYKWFALASAQGDQDAGRKRDEVAKALGGGLAAARQAVESFRPRMVESSANEAPTPAGGWDQASVRTEKLTSPVSE